MLINTTHRRPPEFRRLTGRSLSSAPDIIISAEAWYVLNDTPAVNNRKWFNLSLTCPPLCCSACPPGNFTPPSCLLFYIRVWWPWVISKQELNTPGCISDVVFAEMEQSVFDTHPHTSIIFGSQTVQLVNLYTRSMIDWQLIVRHRFGHMRCQQQI